MRRRPPRFVIALSLAAALVPGVPRAAEPAPAATADRATAPDIFARKNLVAWCIVPFDGKERSPAERAAMLESLGITRVAYDWRPKHVPEFEAEILEYAKRGIDYVAFWSTHPEAFALFRKHGLEPQIWITAPSPEGATDAERVAAAAARLGPLAAEIGGMGCRLGLYNHGGWGGEPANLVAVCEALRAAGHEDVGIVYNLHHGHGHIADFPACLAAMRPYLLCLNLNGMTEGTKILQLGRGEHDLAILRAIRASGYAGPIGIIGHTGDDVEARLRDNLDGLDWLLPQLDGRAPGPPPAWRTP
jgi:sugar phosphate isomerase/epimerase